ncbi:hypothetical protein D3C71_1673070 [compost metagenome]
MNCATPEVEYWMRLVSVWPISAGATIQPTRQPVMHQFLEKDWAKMIRSSLSITSMKDGARAPSK